MKILITPDGYIPKSHELPTDGRTYYLEDAEEYTPPMRRLWEALVDEWYRSGLWDFVDSMDKWKFREEIKRRYGEGFDRVNYVDENYKIVSVKNRDEIPDDIALDFASGNRERIKGVIKSTTNYTQKQFTKMIDNTITAMQDAGVDTPKFLDIIETITEERV